MLAKNEVSLCHTLTECGIVFVRQRDRVMIDMSDKGNQSPDGFNLFFNHALKMLSGKYADKITAADVNRLHKDVSGEETASFTDMYVVSRVFNAHLVFISSLGAWFADNARKVETVYKDTLHASRISTTFRGIPNRDADRLSAHRREPKRSMRLWRLNLHPVLESTDPDAFNAENHHGLCPESYCPMTDQYLLDCVLNQIALQTFAAAVSAGLSNMSTQRQRVLSLDFRCWDKVKSHYGYGDGKMKRYRS